MTQPFRQPFDIRARTDHKTGGLRLSEHECDAPGSVDGVYLLHKFVGTMKNLLEMVS
jgi:hypothetical protein